MDEATQSEATRTHIVNRVAWSIQQRSRAGMEGKERRRPRRRSRVRRTGGSNRHQWRG